MINVVNEIIERIIVDNFVYFNNVFPCQQVKCMQISRFPIQASREVFACVKHLQRNKGLIASTCENLLEFVS